MKKRKIYDSLLDSLERAYLNVSLAILHNRMQAYHRRPCMDEASSAKHVRSPLLEYLDSLRFPRYGDPGRDATATRHVSTSSNHPQELPGEQAYAFNRKDVGELSRYFKARANGSELHPGIETKLESSTWEHLHAAIRHAKMGDDQNARMHANIACSACRELSHYMGEEKYNDFVSQVEQHLQDLQVPVPVPG